MAEVFWEKAYADLDVNTFGAPSIEVRDTAGKLPPGATVLDLGCGEGRNALYLADCGFDVTAVDISEAGITKLRVLAERRGLKVSACVADMRDYVFAQSFDLIMCHGCLHLIEREAWQELIRRAREHTIPGGFNIMVVFTDLIAPPDDIKDLCVGLFREGELFSLYSDWETVLQRSYTFEDQHPFSPPHTHPVNKLVVRKP